jgi:hypothetical protein
MHYIIIRSVNLIILKSAMDVTVTDDAEISVLWAVAGSRSLESGRHRQSLLSCKLRSSPADTSDCKAPSYQLLLLLERLAFRFLADLEE